MRSSSRYNRSDLHNKSIRRRSKISDRSIHHSIRLVRSILELLPLVPSTRISWAIDPWHRSSLRDRLRVQRTSIMDGGRTPLRVGGRTRVQVGIMSPPISGPPFPRKRGATFRLVGGRTPLRNGGTGSLKNPGAMHPMGSGPMHPSAGRIGPLISSTSSTLNDLRSPPTPGTLRNASARNRRGVDGIQSGQVDVFRMV